MHACRMNTHRQMQIGRKKKKKLREKSWTRKDEHAFRASPSETAAPGRARAFFITAAEGRMGKRISFK